MTTLRLWPDTNGPTGFASSAAQKTLATEFEVTSGTWWLTELRVWRGAWDMVGPLRGRVFAVSSPSVGVPVPGTDVVIKVKGLGWQVAPLPAPVLLTTGQIYRACYWTPSGACSTANYW